MVHRELRSDNTVYGDLGLAFKSVIEARHFNRTSLYEKMVGFNACYSVHPSLGHTNSAIFPMEKYSLVLVVGTG